MGGILKYIKFDKMHGLGNDFVVIDVREGSSVDYAKFARKICDRREGVGCDQLLLVGRSEKADLFMHIFNNDGSSAQMCGNGIRCVASLVSKKDKRNSNQISIETLSGVHKIFLYSDFDAEVEMGKPRFEPDKIPVKSEVEIINKPHVFNDFKCNISTVSLGNPHCVILGDDELLERVEELGPTVEFDPLFPERTNVEFVKMIDRRNLKVRVWERGTGETRACGSGACATMAVCKKLDIIDDTVTISMPGGHLKVRWDGRGSIFLRGRVSWVYEGTIDPDNLCGLEKNRDF